MKRFKTRKIVQVCTAPAGPSEESFGVLYALCDDGTLWWKDETGNVTWQLEEDIPQEDVDALESRTA